VQVFLAKPVSERAQFVAARFPEDRLDVERERELYGLAGGARRGNDDDASSGSRADECIVVWRKIRIADRTKRGVGN
jgi:hypothetical protein